MQTSPINLQTISVTLLTDISYGSYVDFPYPTGYSQTDFSETLSLSGSLNTGANEYVVEKAGLFDITVEMLETVIRVTNYSTDAWPAGETVYLSRIYPDYDSGTLAITQEDYNASYGKVPAGVLLSKTEFQTISPGKNDILTWDAVQFENGLTFFDPNYPTRITVPEGVRYMSFAAGITWDSGNKQGVRKLHIIKNKFGTAGMPKQQCNASGGHENLNVYHALVPVKPGDFFEVRVYHTDGADLAVTDNVSTWFQGVAY